MYLLTIAVRQLTLTPTPHVVHLIPPISANHLWCVVDGGRGFGALVYSHVGVVGPSRWLGVVRTCGCVWKGAATLLDKTTTTL